LIIAASRESNSLSDVMPKHNAYYGGAAISPKGRKLNGIFGEFEPKYS
jgi:hypothetical protein